MKLVLEAPNEAEEKRRRAIAFAEASEEEKKIEKEVTISRPNEFSFLLNQMYALES